MFELLQWVAKLAYLPKLGWSATPTQPNKQKSWNSSRKHCDKRKGEIKESYKKNQNIVECTKTFATHYSPGLTWISAKMFNIVALQFNILAQTVLPSLILDHPQGNPADENIVKTTTKSLFWKLCIHVFNVWSI